MSRNTIIISAALFILIMLSLSAYGTSRPGFCKLCHQMRTRSDALDSSVHKGIGCLACHQEPGALGYAGFSIKEFTNFPKVFFKSGNLNASVSDKSCNRCHEAVSEAVLFKDEISISHQHFTSKGYKCVDCHNTVAHGKITARPNYPSIDKCLVCHDNKTAPKYPRLFEADKKGGTPWAVIHGENRMSVHGAGNLKNCQGCHSQHFCRKCHQVDIPHPDDFTFEHGKLSMEPDASCFTCHKPSLCSDCHKTRMPHKSNWLSVHAKQTGLIGEKACLNCHVKYECLNCHERHIHPGQGKDGKITGI